MIKKGVWRQLHIEDETWLDELGYAYNDDTLETYKIHKNGFRLGVLFDSSSIHMDAKTSVYDKKSSAEKVRLRSMSSFLIWHRAIYSSARGLGKIASTLSFLLKALWQSAGLCLFSIVRLNPALLINYFKGLKAGLKMVKSAAFKNLKPYVFKKD